MWIDPIRGSTTFFDTAPVIYFVEENAHYLDTVSPFFAAAVSGSLHAITSVVTLSESLVMPLRTGAVSLAETYRELLAPSAGIAVYPVTQQIAEEAAQIRATHPRIRTPDALQMATAVVAGAQYFLTNDKALPNLPTLQMLVVDDLAQA